jgi:predicted XRE-type DNA-binding protein
MEKLKHWTQRSVGDFVYRVASDFVVQLEKKLEKDKISHKELADVLHVSPGRVSQVLNNPGNLTLKNTVVYARALRMKVAVVAYEDGDPENNKGPIASEIFSSCWKRLGGPRNFFVLSEMAVRIHQLQAYPQTSENTDHMRMYQAWPEEVACTSQTERVN